MTVLCIRKKFRDVFTKNSIRIRLATKPHVMCVILLAFYFASAIVIKPIVVKGPSLIPRHEGSELFNSCLQIRENASQHLVKINLLVRPFSWLRIKTAKFIENTITKFLFGLIELADFLKSNVKAILNKISDYKYQSNNQTNK